MTTNPFSELIPVAPLKIYAHPSCEKLGALVNEDLIKSREQDVAKEQIHALNRLGYQSTSYLLDADCPRFGSGEAKAKLNESVRGKDLFILADVTNHSGQYKIGEEVTATSPDSIFQDIKRIIAACNGKPYRTTVILPYLYENRQNRRNVLESLDCATALQELYQMGVENIITFDSHDPTVQNAIPIQGFDNFSTAFQFIRKIAATEKDMQFDEDHLMIVSPDDGGMSRAVYYANVLGVNMGMFYKKRNYETKVDDNGKNPIIGYEFLGNSVADKDVLIVDDMIASGTSILEIAYELKKRHARRIYIAATFGLFSDGYERFDKAYQDGVVDRIYTTNLVYSPETLLQKPYYVNVDLSKYISLIINTLNHDTSVNDILVPTLRIQELLSSLR
ncbi:ribose-phosphate pyrophosphokinase [Anaerosporobacter faecicola]|uniref:ribose-phosphate pyrophosphokinase n=1 Tax=Anaerosporobacter faecicola TaxID=2718714 RepID=UPI00143C5E61|nr:ribose-phosphate pyrophosphokinase [Anaerosporobacter faecicola]